MGKYLGLSEHFGRKKNDLFASIVDRMKQIALNWSNQFLYTVGKAVMILSVLSTIPSYPMTCFELPISLCIIIQFVLTRFWWDGADGTKKICWIAWDKMTFPKNEGGLGFHDIQAFNKALLAKIGWRIITKPDCLLAKVLLGKYCTKTSFFKVQTASNISHRWRSILSGRDLLVQHLGKAIGNEEATSLWRDSWIKPYEKLMPIGPVFLKDNDLMVSDFLNRETRKWNKTLVEKLLPELASHILVLRPSILGAPDTVVWPLNKSGVYDVKSGYFSTLSTRNQSTPRLLGEANCDWKNLIWSQRLSPKIKFFLWKIAVNALPTGTNLWKD